METQQLLFEYVFVIFIIYISIIGGTPTIHVIGEGNSVSSGNNTGIAVSNGATVTMAIARRTC